MIKMFPAFESLLPSVLIFLDSVFRAGALLPIFHFLLVSFLKVIPSLLRFLLPTLPLPLERSVL